ncbi:MAG: NUDIX domain-containing protein [Alphaproteobacteria bacterium]|nr:MAG: NUDIX domain-containing protein [Alphaproteobacteria bacterium]
MTRALPPYRPVTPRPAASLVIYEKRGDNVYVLMGRRAKAHRFLPNVYVFPGGRVDTADARTPVLAPLHPEVANRLSRPAGMAEAIATAAVRETFEETGLVIGALDGGVLRPDLSQLDYLARAITPPMSPIRFNTRFLTVDVRHVEGELRGSGELIDLKWVTLGEAMTMPLVDVTEFIIGEIDRHLTDPETRRTDIPLFRYVRGKARIRGGGHG